MRRQAIIWAKYGIITDAYMSHLVPMTRIMHISAAILIVQQGTDKIDISKNVHRMQLTLKDG